MKRSMAILVDCVRIGSKLKDQFDGLEFEEVKGSKSKSSSPKNAESRESDFGFNSKKALPAAASLSCLVEVKCTPEQELNQTLIPRNHFNLYREM